MSKKINKEQEAKKIKEELDKLEAKQKTEDLIKDNCVEFKYKDSKYKIEKPSFDHHEEIRKKRAKKYRELLDEDNYLPRKVIKEKLKKKGINIDEMNNKIEDYKRDIKNVRLRLAPVKDKKVREKLKKQIMNLEIKIHSILIEQDEWLNPCLESELNNYTNSYLVYLTLKKKNKDKYQNAFNSYKEMMNNISQELLSMASYYLSILIYENEQI